MRFKLVLATEQGEVLAQYALDSEASITAKAYPVPLFGFGKTDLVQSINDEVARKLGA